MTPNGKHEQLGSQAATSDLAMEWLPLDCQPAALQIASPYATSTTAPSRWAASAPSWASGPRAAEELLVADEPENPWVPGPGTASTVIEVHRRTVAEFEQARTRRARVLIRENRGALSGGVVLTAVAAPAVIAALDGPAVQVHSAPALAVVHAHRRAAPVVSTRRGRYRLTRRRAVRRHRALTLGTRQASQTRPVIVASVALPTRSAASVRPVVRSVSVSSGHVGAPPRASAVRSKPVASKSPAGGSSGSSPSSPPPNPGPVQSAVDTVQSTASHLP
jgi:hypothetical protein